MHPITFLTRRLGRDAETAYECRNCAARYRIQYHVCPTCESFSVEAETQTWAEERRQSDS